MIQMAEALGKNRILKNLALVRLDISCGLSDLFRSLAFNTTLECLVLERLDDFQPDQIGQILETLPHLSLHTLKIRVRLLENILSFIDLRVESSDLCGRGSYNRSITA